MNSDDDFSDLTDLDDEDEYKARPTKNKGTSVLNGGGYQITNALKPPRATTYTTQALNDQIHDGQITLDAQYQRDVVWPDAKKIGLIDSIFRNFYIPPVIFAMKISEDGSEVRICIDGKQRLTSIQRFMDGIIHHRDPRTGEKLWYKDLKDQSQSKKLLPEKYRRIFANKQIVCVEYQDITEADEREIFQRVQLGMALTPAEKLQVINTPRAEFIRTLLASFLLEDGGLSGNALDWDTSRGGDFRCFSQAVFCIDKYNASFNNAGSIPQIEKWLSCEDSLNPAFQFKVEDTYQVFVDLVQDKALSKPFKKPAKISPIEFILISLLIATHKDTMSKHQLSAAVGQMRDGVRAEHLDIRMNNRVAKTMIDFIRQVRPGKISGDAGGIAGSKMRDKRKRSDDEDADKGAKSQKKSSPAIATASSSATVTPVPQQSSVSAPPQNSAPSSLPAKRNVPDRTAALRAAKNATGNSALNPPSYREPNKVKTAPNTSIVPSPVPPQLPSPGVAFSYPRQYLPQNLPQPPQQQYASLEASLMASMSQPNEAQSHYPQGQASENRQDYSYNGGYPSESTHFSSNYDRARERDRDRDRDRDHHASRQPPSSGGPYGGFNYRR